MSYSTGEARILTILRLHVNYDATNTDRQDWKILHSGKKDRYVILRPGAWRNEPHGLGGSAIRHWSTVAEVWTAYRDDSRPISLQGYYDEVLGHLEKYPTLSGLLYIQDSQITGGGEMIEKTLQNGSLWAVWELNIEWHEEKTITFAE